MAEQKDNREASSLQRSRQYSYLIFGLIFIYVLFKCLYLITHPLIYENDLLKMFSMILDSDFVNLMMIGAYTLVTFRMFDEMHIQRIRQERPILIAKLEPLGVSGTVLRIINTGKGNAYNISVKHYLRRRTETRDGFWNHSLLQPSEFVRLVLPEKTDYLTFLKSFDSVTIDFAYESQSREQIRDTVTLNLQELAKGVENNFWIVERTADEDMCLITEAVKGMNVRLESIAASLKEARKS